MLWVTWRQHRTPVLLTAGLLLVLGTILLVHGLLTADFIRDRASAGCPGTGPDCLAFEQEVRLRYQQIYQLIGWLPVAPALIGAFWGAPLLAKEFEHGTHKFAWTQSVPRRRWLTVKFGLLGLTTVLSGLALGGMTTAWLSTFRGTGLGDAFGDKGLFAVAGVVPGAWWLFSFALGVAAGATIRRTLPAMAVTLAVFAVSLFGVFAARPFYAAPQRAVQVSAEVSPLPADAILMKDVWLTTSGQEVSRATMVNAIADACRAVSASVKYYQCAFEEGYTQVVYFHPSTKFWQFQWTETGILVLISLVLGVLAFVSALRRRI
ncbi:transporter [Rhizocola hellebori]|uniref:Transporter n=1 Tax=Rhizocola hellebori TaxID=1392758 RepID=A0A8J3QFX9_9ACTN|nr:ABC transporter permease subunit [Rhizocola hellebori]GIH08917.1 transporter [Rhizocola hellebori]